MNGWRARWSQVLIALAVIAAVAIAGSALGGQSATTAVTVSKKKLKKLIRKEVSKQISNATGPPGANGLSGSNGANGLDGTARAYARVISHESDSCTTPTVGCTFDRSKGVASVTRLGVGVYCVIAPGISRTAVAPAVTVDWFVTSDPQGNSSAMADPLGDCAGDNGFVVRTERLPTGTPVAAAPADNVSFTIVIP